MNSKGILSIVGIIIIAVIGLIWWQSAPAPTPALNGDTLNDEENLLNDDLTVNGDEDLVIIPPSEQVSLVSYTNDGYDPDSLIIEAGSTVIFENESDRPVWTATGMHPTHTLYPGSDINKCDTPEEESIFDSCRGINPGDSWSFVFDEIGEWVYHNHLNPSFTGKIIVIE